MEFRQLRYFLAVAEHLHFTAAAEMLGIAQPPLSQQIIKLEKEIGTRLFIRYARRVELTEAGEIFRESARRILDDASDALEKVKRAARGEVGHIRIGFAGSVVFNPWVANTLRCFRNAYPDVLIKTEESNSALLVEKVGNSQVDCAFVRLPLNCSNLVTLPLVEEEFIAVLPSGHRLGKESAIDLAELSSDSFILFPRTIGPDLYDLIISGCRLAGFAPKVEIESPQLSSTVNMVAAGFGVTLVPACMQSIHANGNTYHRMKENDLITTIALAVRPRDKSVTIRNFVETLRHVSKASVD
ncbi:LysR family transcriptional regulator YnfL [Pseudomonas chlororaphis]|uniref:LysR family transcriptional regulator YnfL n=1 Tax=Pseudomonas chlororaphis TaxID=587753 RepID=A0A3G7TU80_9PSED|nr:LysR family transcriptional regulator [Pseudomonas chlororaphis]AZE50685.1 LysR family transcriptional regulator YnfL [Pseudomonas chlororaphis]